MDLSWPARFRARHGRAPRILHIGNVANYAFVNATLMRRHGIDADVIDPDSYHVMATPAWSEALVDGDWGDDFNPDWGGVDLGGYEPPDWFAQGPRDLVLAFAAARGTGDDTGAARARDALTGSVSRRSTMLRAAALAGPWLQWAPALREPLRRIARAWAYRGAGSSLAPTQNPKPAPLTPGAPPEIVELSGAPALRAALAGYDVVQGYGLGAMYGLAAGHPVVTAYELGTLRGLPAEDSSRGRLCAWVYRNAHAVLVTNSDCLAVADALLDEPARRHAMLHAFDAEAVSGEADREPTAADAVTAEPYFFAPARHHWVAGSTSFLKGNDRLIEAAAVLAAEGRAFRLVFVAWGDDIEASRALIARHGLQDRVTWLKPLSRRRLWPLYRDACAVTDQFGAAALGGVGLETLALARRLITRYDAEAGRAYFAEQPPVLGCATVPEIAAAMRLCLDDPADQARRGAAGQAWIRGHHGVRRQMADQFAIFESLISGGARACAS